MDQPFNILLIALPLLTGVAWAIRRFFFSSKFPNIPGPAAASFTKGNVYQLMDRHSGDWTKQLVETHGPCSRLSAPFGREWLHVFDPKALYSMAIKDQEVWSKNNGSFNTTLIGPGLLNTDGHQHRKQRKMLTPVFSTTYLRNMTSLFYETSYKVRDGLVSDIGTDRKEVDVLKWTGRAALELIGQGTLGYSFDAFAKDKPNPFAESVKSFFGALNGIAPLRVAFLPILTPLLRLPASVRRMAVDMAPIERVQRLKAVVDTMNKKSEEIVNEKKTLLEKGDEALLYQVGEGKDIMSILLKANSAADEKERLTDEEVTAQISRHGHNIQRRIASRLLHLLAMNPDVQIKLRNEIMEAQAGEEVPYDLLMELPYLDAVCRETLRLHGPVRLVSRRAREDTVLPLHEPIRGRDGSLIPEVAVPKGTVVVMNLWACNTNKALWGEDAYEWKPARWLAPLPPAVEQARIPGVYSNLMSFHGGGRSCIGFKYAQLELKVVLSVLLANFEFQLGDQPIVWKNAGVAYPTVGKESRKAEMPLRVSVLAG